MADYFTSETEEYIRKFQESEDPNVRNDIFCLHIQPAFWKLIENVVFVYKFSNLNDIKILKYDCLSFLYENLHKFDFSKGCKAFSFFNVIVKNWFIQKVKIKKKRCIKTVELNQEVINYIERQQIDQDLFKSDSLNQEYLQILNDEIVSWGNKFDKEYEHQILDALYLIINNYEFISIYNREAILFYVKEITGLSTKQVVAKLIKFKKKYKKTRNLFITRHLEK